MRDRLNLTLPVEMIEQIRDLSERKSISRSAIVEAAVASFLSPDNADRREAAFARRMDRLSRQVQRLERDLGVTAETVALFVRFWLTITPPFRTTPKLLPKSKAENVTRDLSKLSACAFRRARVSCVKYPMMSPAKIWTKTAIRNQGVLSLRAKPNK